jgi:hypothetical protein
MIHIVMTRVSSKDPPPGIPDTGDDPPGSLKMGTVSSPLSSSWRGHAMNRMMFLLAVRRMLQGFEGRVLKPDRITQIAHSC